MDTELLDVYKDITLFCTKKKIIDYETKKPLICDFNRNLFIDFLSDYNFDTNYVETRQIQSGIDGIEHNENFDVAITMFWEISNNDFIDETLVIASNLLCTGIKMAENVNDLYKHIYKYEKYMNYLAVVLDEINRNNYKMITENFDNNILRICNKLNHLLKKQIKFEDLKDFIYNNTPEGRVLNENNIALEYISDIIKMNDKYKLIKYDWYNNGDV